LGTYDSGGCRQKHKWNHEEAGFANDYGKSIGKCSSMITQDVAQRLLDDGIPYPDANNPERIYNVFHGVIYMAISSGNNNWHGFPWRKLPGRKLLPASVKTELETRSDTQDHLKEFRAWMKNYG
jgi:hypothetical protein